MNTQEALEYQENIENHAAFCAWGGHYTLEYLQQLETIRHGHYGELKIEDGAYSIWLGSSGKGPYQNTVTIVYNQQDSFRPTPRVYAQYPALVAI